MMAATNALVPPPSSQFEVVSGALCFGGLEEVARGSAADIADPTAPLPFGAPDGASATVLSHPLAFNLRAASGTWNAYYLRQDGDSDGEQGPPTTATAAFCCHDESCLQLAPGLLPPSSPSVLSPLSEIRRILEAANAPWEPDNPALRNTPESFRGRVLVVNRYDWTQEGYAEEARVGITGGEEGRRPPGEGGERGGDGGDVCLLNSRWLVDYEQAGRGRSVGGSVAEAARSWCESGKGIRLVVQGEYMYGRFGLAPDGSRAQSFLLFTGHTRLASSHIAGDPARAKVYVPLTPEERHSRRLADGTYLGYGWLRTRSGQRPAPADQVGPFFVGGAVEAGAGADAGDMVLPGRDVENALLALASLTFEPQLRRDTLVLLNESLAAYVFRLGRIADGAGTLENFRNLAFGAEGEGGRHQHPGGSLLRGLLRRAAAQEDDEGGLLDDGGGLVFVEGVHRVVPSDRPLWSYLSIRQVSRCLRVLVGEVLELAGNCVRDDHDGDQQHDRIGVVPRDVRMVILSDQELCDEGLHCSWAFWLPPPDAISAAARDNEIELE